jgi:hypothetical protein
MIPHLAPEVRHAFILTLSSLKKYPHEGGEE